MTSPDKHTAPDNEQVERGRVAMFLRMTPHKRIAANGNFLRTIGQLRNAFTRYQKHANRQLMAIVALLLPAALLLACSGAQAKKESVNAPIGPHRHAPARTFVYECDGGYNFTARIEGETAWLFLPRQTVKLNHVRSGSGAKYSNGQITVWSKGDKARLETGEEKHLYCRNNRAKAVWEAAKLNGVDFRAVGNKPGWYLEISRGDKFVFVGDYGRTRYEFTRPDPQVNTQERGTTYRVRAGGHDLNIVIEGRPCRDTISREAFESTVTVILDGKKYRGCGRALH